MTKIGRRLLGGVIALVGEPLRSGSFLTAAPNGRFAVCETAQRAASKARRWVGATRRRETAIAERAMEAYEALAEAWSDGDVG
jgi:hypothetical protein